MEANQQPSERFLKAKKKVDSMKKFYHHLRVYIIINALLLVVKLNLYNWFRDDYQWIQNPEFGYWFNWNIIGTPVLWGIGLLIHGICVFKFGVTSWKELKPEFMKKWEKRQLDKFLQDENKKNGNN
ncbi:2TM domain-containing protein [Maribacter sp. 2210JD10-5]|uniref:2TM domain-containing protein n=1 Tax=Maribacter sp. 2210JD10-5 TaxID=3386272 RepID=UPI0039BCBF57